MQKLLTAYLLTLLTLPVALAQRTVEAREIFAKIDRKEAVSYENVTVNGDLDLTSLSNRRDVSKQSWEGASESYLSVVEVPVTFRNCTFNGKFLAYRNDPKTTGLFGINNKNYNANFSEAVTIENCTFEEEVAFKYSELSQRAVFRGNTFRQGAIFKYTRFRNDADFSGSTFRRFGDFKYTHFDEAISFENVRFEGVADFKYTHFEEGVNFKSTRFNQTADFKYAHLPRGSSFDNATFDGPSDFKYATLDGRRFSPGR